MTARPRNLQRQRDRIAELLRADPSRSLRSVAVEVGCSHTTVGRLAGQLASENEPANVANGQHPGAANLIAPASTGNLRALKHGVDSERRLAPLRTRFEPGLRDEFPWLDARRLFLLADLLARVEAAREWLDERGGVVRNRAGDVFPVVDRLERWSARADTLLRELHAEKVQREHVDPQAALAAHLAELAAGREAES
jgi:hypothetical protein